MGHDCRNIMRISYNVVDDLLDRDHPNNVRACVCQKALESDIEAGVLPDREDATKQDRQQAVDQACRESFRPRASFPYTDSPEKYVTRARGRYERDLHQVVERRQRVEESNRQLAEDMQKALDATHNWLDSLLSFFS